MAAPFYLIVGFLGSGKTTLLKRLIADHAEARRIAVVQNEFAAVNVDAHELARTGKPFHLLEVNRGSVFCVCLIADFKTSLAQFIDEYRPDAILLEASGLADPIAVAELLTAPELQQRTFLAHVRCIVDASNFMLLEKNNLRLTHQVRVADVVLINKIDLVADDELERVEARIRAINPTAEPVRTTFCKMPTTLPLNAQILAEPIFEAPLGRPAVGTAVIKTAQKMRTADLERFINELEPHVWRIKGFVNLKEGGTVTVQSVFGTTQLTPLEDYQGITELIVIGPEVEQAEVVEHFRRLCRDKSLAS